MFIIGGIMKSLNVKIMDVASHLQSLNAPDIFPKVQDAVARKDKNLLIKVCRKAKVPDIYLSIVVSVLLAISPNQKWPSTI